MPVALPLVIVIVAVPVAVLVLVARNRSTDSADPVAFPPPDRVRAADIPMTGLESALSQVTDRDGRPIRDRIDAETGHVDELRVPDDTGPLLRRALDHVANEPAATEEPPPGHGTTADDGPNDEEDGAAADRDGTA